MRANRTDRMHGLSLERSREMADWIVGRCCGETPIAETVGPGVIRIRCPVCGRRTKSIAVHYDSGGYIIQDIPNARKAIDAWNHGGEATS